MKEKVRLLDSLLRVDPLLIVGIVISIALALILVLLGQDEVSSLLVGLITTTITLLIDTIARLRETENRILQATALGNLLSNDEKLHSAMHQIAKSYVAVQKSGFDLFVQKSVDALLECKDILGGLERGYMLTQAGGKYSFGKRGVDVAKKTIKALAYEDADSWRTDHLKDVIQANAEAVKRGVQIQRVFILSDDSLSQASDVLQVHKDAGVQVFVVSPEDLPSTQLLESYLVVDDRILVVFYFTRDGRHFREEKISVEPVEVDRAISRFNSVLRRAKAYE